MIPRYSQENLPPPIRSNTIPRYYQENNGHFTRNIVKYMSLRASMLMKIHK